MRTKWKNSNNDTLKALLINRKIKKLKDEKFLIITCLSAMIIYWENILTIFLKMLRLQLLLYIISYINKKNLSEYVSRTVPFSSCHSFSHSKGLKYFAYLKHWFGLFLYKKKWW